MKTNYLKRKPFKPSKPLKKTPFHKTAGKSKKEDNSPKLWKLKRADTEFRKVMLKSVPLKCVFPECPITDPNKLTVSHYHGRAKKGTRFSVLNCDFICRNHHYWDKQLGYEFQKQTKEKHGWDGRYTLYMKNKLGDKLFTELEELANSGMKPKIAIYNFQYGNQPKNNP